MVLLMITIFKIESKGNKDKILTAGEYLDITRPYLNMINKEGERSICSGDKIINKKTQSEWKMKLIMQINFISFKDSDEARIMHTKSNDVENITRDVKDDIIKVIFESLLERYQEGYEEPMRGSEFIFDSADALYYDLNKISLNRGESYIDSPE